VFDQETSKTRRLNPATGLWKIQPQNAKKINNKQLEGKVTDWGLIGHIRRFNRLAIAYNEAGFCTEAGII
jgi:hypothetical protein